MGSFGKAIASLVEYNGYVYDYAEPGKPLSQPADIVFLTVPTQFVREALTANKDHMTSQTIIVNAAKGIEEGSHLMVHQIVKSLGNYPNYYSLIGPSFAHGILEQEPTVVSLGYKDPSHLKTIQNILQTPYFRVEPSKGFRALELASALKNMYAIICGYSSGLGFGANTQAQLITIALHEFTILAKAMHFADYNPDAPGVVGDLILTCSSRESRNFQFGLMLAENRKVSAVPEETVEGYHTSHSINIIAKEQGTLLPLAKLTAQVINGNTDGQHTLRDFLAKY